VTDAAIQSLLAEAEHHEVVPARVAIKLARAFARAGQPLEAVRWAVAVVDAEEDFASWIAAAEIVRGAGAQALPNAVRSLKLAVLGSYNTSQISALLPLAAAHHRIAIQVYECDYGQYRNEIFDPSSGLYASGPDAILLAVHDGDLALPAYSEDAERDIETELRRWVTWTAQGDPGHHHSAQLRPTTGIATGHLGARPPGPGLR
jgi:hypothetical protein